VTKTSAPRPGPSGTLFSSQRSASSYLRRGSAAPSMIRLFLAPDFGCAAHGLSPGRDTSVLCPPQHHSCVSCYLWVVERGDRAHSSHVRRQRVHVRAASRRISQMQMSLFRPPWLPPMSRLRRPAPSPLLRSMTQRHVIRVANSAERGSRRALGLRTSGRRNELS
jgi:hypothetical protein